jgi:CRP-like cAMP-binding protein
MPRVAKHKGPIPQDDKRTLAHLKKVPLLQELPAEVLRSLVPHAEMKEYRKRQVVFLPGDPGNTVLFVHQGRIKVSKVTLDGKELTLAYRGPGDLCGELSLVAGGPREEMAEAADALLITELNRDVFDELIKAHHALAYRMVHLAIERRREIENQIEYILFKDVGTKLAELILKLAGEHGVDNPRGTLVTLKITHQEMANLIGSTRETVSLTLSQFKKKGLIYTEGRRVIVANYEGLRAMC